MVSREAVGVSISSSNVIGVSASRSHKFSKAPCDAIEIVKGLGVRGDAHAGERVQHLSRVKADPNQPNLRQVHLIHAELFEEMAEHSFDLMPGDLGENITTQGIDLLALGRGSLLQIGPQVVLEVTGLRNPCHQIDGFATGLLKHLALKTPQGIVRKAGIMTIVCSGGLVRPGDPINVEAAAGPHIPLERV
jgi:MOSC domain-containing protein YiiM